MSAPVRQLFLLLALDIYHHMSNAQEAIVKYNFREEQPNETFVGNVARDSLLYGNVTQEEFDQMRFQILTEGNKDANYFKLEEISSTLRSAEVINRDTICEFQLECKLGFDVAVYKQDPNTDLLDLYKIIQIEVLIEDINDNAPEFPESEISLSVQESAPVNFVLLTSGALDRDTGKNNSVQSYHLIPSNEMFGLKEIKNFDGSSDLGLVVLHPLDRETRDFYQVQVMAKDGGFPQRTGTVTINITVTDTNDNNPMFSEASYSVLVPENKPVGSVVLKLTAEDLDIGQNKEVTFSFNTRVPKKVMDTFSVNETSGEIYITSALDFEQDKKFQFLVEARDNGQPSLSSSAMVTIDITDLNDNAPQININLPPGGTDIAESAEIGRYVANVAISDLDSGSNCKVRCNVVGNFFQLDELYPNMYKITIKNKLDYEKQTTHNVTIFCNDQGIPQKQNSTSFLIRVEDVNDKHPVFSMREYRSSIVENNKAGTYITTVTATDVDTGEGGRVTYFLHHDGSEQFDINPRTGVITAKQSLDREVKPVIYFHVNATDNGSPRLSSSALVILALTDVNDVAPTFNKSLFEFLVLENQIGNPTVGKLLASDGDAGSNGQFYFDFVLPRPLEFMLDSNTGVIRAAQKLDRELRENYTFSVIAIDKGSPSLNSTATVIVRVIDSNDNIPIIRYPNNFNNTVSIIYSTAVGTIITKVEAYDIDQGDNSKLRYYIDQINYPDKKDLFNLDVYTGYLTLAKTMHIYDANTYRLVLAVQDHGIQEQISYTNLNIEVTVGNDTVPPIPPEETGNQHILTVVIIIIVTIILSVAILATIFVIRRNDRGRRNNNNQAKKMEPNMYAARTEESLSTYSSKISDGDDLKKKNKKEVSFSLSDESDSMNTSSLTNITNCSNIKNQYSGLSSITADGKIIPNPQACSSLLTNNTLYSDISKDSYDKKYDITRLQHDQRPTSPNQMWYRQLQEEEARHLRELLKKADDVNSETSAESATSDSGRGGSEEDVNSNRGHPLSDTEDIKNMYPIDNRRGEINHQNRHSNMLHSNFKHSPGKAVPIRSDYHRNISFSDDSVTANTTVDSSKSRNKLKYGEITPHKNLSDLSLSALNMSNTPYKTRVQRELKFVNGRTLDTLNEATQSGIAYSLQDIDDTVSESVMTRDDDDKSTTTSGSYTINPDELCDEIDELFFKDVIV